MPSLNIYLSVFQYANEKSRRVVIISSINLTGLSSFHFQEVHKLCEDGTIEEENTFNIKISADMSKEEVLRTILETVK